MRRLKAPQSAVNLHLVTYWERRSDTDKKINFGIGNKLESLPALREIGFMAN